MKRSAQNIYSADEFSARGDIASQAKTATRRKFDRNAKINDELTLKGEIRSCINICQLGEYIKFSCSFCGGLSLNVMVIVRHTQRLSLGFCAPESDAGLLGEEQEMPLIIS